MINKIAYHGSNARFVEFTDKTKRIKDDLYGGGLAYFTDEDSKAAEYAKAMQKKYGGFQFVYKVSMKLHEIFDVDHEYTGEIFLKIFKQTRYSAEEFARRAGLLIYGVNKYEVFGNIKSGKAKYKGEVIFKGLSNGMNETKKAQDILKKVGFDGLRYNGGVNMNMARHNVFCPYYPESIKILDVDELNPLSATHPRA